MTKEVSMYQWWLAQAGNMKNIDEIFQKGGQAATSILAINQIQYMKAMLEELEERYVSEEVRNRYNIDTNF